MVLDPTWLGSGCVLKWQPVCREVGTNILDLVPQGWLDGRRLEVVAKRLPLFHWAQLAIDTTLVSPERRDGLPRARCEKRDRAAIVTVRKKVRTYPELTGRFGRAKLVVLACGAGSGPTRHRLSCGSSPGLRPACARAAWLRLSMTIMASSSARARHLHWKRGGMVGVTAPLLPQPKRWGSTASSAVGCELVGK